MARKNLLSAEPISDEPSIPSATPLQSEQKPPAISAMRRSLEATFAASVQDINPDHIDQDGIADRMGRGDEDIADLVESIRSFGQRVPVLVRPNPVRSGRYIVVYGRRRIRAVRAIGGGRTVKALILSETLDDQALVRIQGQENSVRRDLTFIERAMFAKNLGAAGYDNKLIREALNIDKAGLSQMRAVTDGALPVGVIELIGAAPGIGRDRWIGLAKKFAALKPPFSIERLTLGDEMTSDQRFFAVMKSVSEAPAPSISDIIEVRVGAALIGTISRGRAGVTISITAKDQPDLHRWIRENPEKALMAFLAAGTSES